MLLIMEVIILNIFKQYVLVRREAANVDHDIYKIMALLEQIEDEMMHSIRYYFSI